MNCRGIIYEQFFTWSFCRCVLWNKQPTKYTYMSNQSYCEWLFNPEGVFCFQCHRPFLAINFWSTNFKIFCCTFQWKAYITPILVVIVIIRYFHDFTTFSNNGITRWQWHWQFDFVTWFLEFGSIHVWKGSYLSSEFLQNMNVVQLQSTMQNKRINISYMNSWNLPPPYSNSLDSLVADLKQQCGNFHPTNKIHRVNNLFNKNISEMVVSSFGIEKSTEHNGLTNLLKWTVFTQHKNNSCKSTID